MSMPKIECTDMDKCCAAASLLQSIALEETAISHILNAEGEKLQKAVKMDDCSYEDLLCINKSVEDMVDKITNLEIVLKSKLDLIKPILDDCGQKPDKDCKSDCKSKDKPDDKPDCKPKDKPDYKPDCKPKDKPDYKPDDKPKYKSEGKSDYKSEEGSGYKPYEKEEGARVSLDIKTAE